LISAVPELTATRDALVREAADRLDVPVNLVLTPPDRSAVATGTGPSPTVSAGELALRAEREFLTLCLTTGAVGRDYLARPADEDFSSDLFRRARRHLVEHFDDPLADLPQDEPAVGALVTDVAYAAQELPATKELVLQMSILQLQQRRIEREIKQVSQSGDPARQSELAAADQRVRSELGVVMGQMT
jgi:hypothetical protein